jgi:citrate lyase subunit beta/citryl-CoA lyase
MKLRSLLFVPCDRPERMRKAQLSQADGVILDLEDSVAIDRKADARTALHSFLSGDERVKPTFVRINPLTSGSMTKADLEALVDHPPDGLVLPKACGRHSIEELSLLLSELGMQHLPIMPIATETPAAIFEIGSYRDVAQRLFALSWGAEDLSASIGAATAREPDGQLTAPYALARSLTLRICKAWRISLCVPRAMVSPACWRSIHRKSRRSMLRSYRPKTNWRAPGPLWRSSLKTQGQAYFPSAAR